MCAQTFDFTLRGNSQYTVANQWYTFKNKLTIDPTKVSFRIYDLYKQKPVLHTVLFSAMPVASYSQGRDPSGDLYELFTLADHSTAWYSHAAFSLGHVLHAEFVLKTWDRQDVFIHIVSDHGKKYHVSDMDTASMVLDQQSRASLESLFSLARSYTR